VRCRISPPGLDQSRIRLGSVADDENGKSGFAGIGGDVDLAGGAKEEGGHSKQTARAFFIAHCSSVTGSVAGTTVAHSDAAIRRFACSFEKNSGIIRNQRPMTRKFLRNNGKLKHAASLLK